MPGERESDVIFAMFSLQKSKIIESSLHRVVSNKFHSKEKLSYSKAKQSLLNYAHVPQHEISHR